MQILEYMQTHWVEWLFVFINGVLGLVCKSLWKKYKEIQKKDDAIAEGLQALLRESIVQKYNKYQDREFCPIYAKESIKKAYTAYHNLGGNDVATKLYNTLLAMPEEAKERKKENEE